MGKYRQQLPQMSGDFFITDGGLETTLIFHDGLDLPHFAAFTLLKDEAGRETLRRYYRNYVAIARERGKETLFGGVLRENTHMLGLARKLGFTISWDREDRLYGIETDLRSLSLGQ